MTICQTQTREENLEKKKKDLSGWEDQEKRLGLKKVGGTAEH